MQDAAWRLRPGVMAAWSHGRMASWPHGVLDLESRHDAS